MADPQVTVAIITGVTGTVGIILSGRFPKASERRKAMRTAEAKARILENALNAQREQIRKDGGTVLPWPSELTDLGKEDDD